MNQIKKILFIGGLTLTSVIGLVGCKSTQPETNTIVCQAEGEHNKGFWYEFELDKDGKTVTRFVNHIGFDKNTIKDMIPNLKTDKEIEKVVTQSAASYLQVLTGYEQSYPDVSWLITEAKSNKTDTAFELSYGVDLTDKTIDLDDEGIREVINSLLTYNQIFYNKNEKRYEVSVDKLETELTKTNSNGFTFTCDNKVVKDMDELEYTQLSNRIKNLRKEQGLD